MKIEEIKAILKNAKEEELACLLNEYRSDEKPDVRKVVISY